MFIRKIPYQSVQRRKILKLAPPVAADRRDRAVVAAFARPFLTQDPTKVSASAAGTRSRHPAGSTRPAWATPITGRRRGSGAEGRRRARWHDRGTLVLFATGEEEAVRATSDHAQLETGLSEAKVSSDARTRYGPGCGTRKRPEPIVAASKEAFLISDFQKTGGSSARNPFAGGRDADAGVRWRPGVSNVVGDEGRLRAGAVPRRRAGVGHGSW